MNPVVKIEFDGFGVIEVELFLDVPSSTGNFLELASKGYYDGLSMHRVIPNFVAQGGCPEGSGMGGPGYTIRGEFKDNRFENNHQHVKGAIAFARSQLRDSAGSQFYLALGDIHFLNDGYAVFGQTIDGFDVLDKLNEKGTEGGTPLCDIIIKKITVELNDNVIPEFEKL